MFRNITTFSMENNNNKKKIKKKKNPQNTLVLTILVFEAFSGIMKRSQNSRISCMLSVISTLPSPSPDTEMMYAK